MKLIVEKFGRKTYQLSETSSGLNFWKLSLTAPKGLSRADPVSRPGLTTWMAWSGVTQENNWVERRTFDKVETYT